MVKEVLTYLGFAISVGACIAIARMFYLFKGIIESPEEIVPATVPAQVEEVEDEETYYALNDEEIYLIARLVEAEAGGEPKEGKQAVAWVVFCRYMFYRSKNIKCTIESVIYEHRQFTTPREKPSIDTLRAVYDIFEIVGGEIVGESVFPNDLFYFRTKRYHEHYGYPWDQIGRHYFSTMNAHQEAPANYICYGMEV